MDKANSRVGSVRPAWITACSFLLISAMAVVTVHHSFAADSPATATDVSAEANYTEPPDPDDGCDDRLWNITKDGKQCFRVYSMEAPFFEAERICRSLHGGGLALPSTDEEVKLVSDMVMKSEPSSWRSLSYWVGLARICPDGAFAWLNGTAFPTNQVTGSSFYTNVAAAAASERMKSQTVCVAIQKARGTLGSTTAPKAVLHACIAKNNFVCQKPFSKPKSPLLEPPGYDYEDSAEDEQNQNEDPINSNDGCPRGNWCRFQDSCYRVEADPQAPRLWTEAELSCEKAELTGDLASIHSQEENEFVQDLVNFYAASRYEDRQYWIGRRIAPAKYGGINPWSDGSFDNGYENWTSLAKAILDVRSASTPAPATKFSPELDYMLDVDEIASDQCASINSNQALSTDVGKWSLLDCATAKLKYVCKRPVVNGSAHSHENDFPLDFYQRDVKECNRTDGWRRYDKFCYKAFNVTVSFKDAVEACKAMTPDGALLTINNVYEQMFVNALMKDADFGVWANASDGFVRSMPSRFEVIRVSSSTRYRLLMNLGCAKLVKGVWTYPMNCGIIDKMGYICTKSPDILVTNETSSTKSAELCDHKKGQVTYDADTCFSFTINQVDGLNQTNAEAACKKEDGFHLASIADYNELQYVYARAAERRMTQFWIGLQISQKDNATYEWTDNSPVQFTFWAEEMSFEQQAQRCVKMTLQPFGSFDPGSIGAHWEFENCATPLPFVCKKSTANYTMSTVSSPDYDCPPEWTRVGENCYWLTATSANATRASTDCRKEESFMASFHSSADLADVREKLKDKLTSDVWIGLRHIPTIFKGRKVAVPEWTDASATNFFPTDFKGVSALSVAPVCTKLSKDGKWVASDCRKPAAKALCKKPAAIPSNSTTSAPTASSPNYTGNTSVAPTAVTKSNVNATAANKQESQTGHAMPGGTVAVVVIIILIAIAGGFVGYRIHQRKRRAAAANSFTRFVNEDDI